MVDAYIDIDTTGLSRYSNQITVIGIGLAKGRSFEVVQLFESKLTPKALRRALEGASRMYTYNGSEFDLPFIEEQLGLDLTEQAKHHDLMYDCWNLNLYGGLKAVERTLQIPRKLAGMRGRDAVRLWERYKHCNDQPALETLLEYNREDVANLRVLREKLRVLRYRP